MSTPAARICGPPMPKISTSARCFRAVARRAAYMSPLASPAERRRGMGVICGRWIRGGDHLIGVSGSGGRAVSIRDLRSNSETEKEAGKKKGKKKRINAEGTEVGAQRRTERDRALAACAESRQGCRRYQVRRRRVNRWLVAGLGAESRMAGSSGCVAVGRWSSCSLYCSW